MSEMSEPSKWVIEVERLIEELSYHVNARRTVGRAGISTSRGYFDTVESIFKDQFGIVTLIMD